MNACAGCAPSRSGRHDVAERDGKSPTLTLQADAGGQAADEDERTTDGGAPSTRADSGAEADGTRRRRRAAPGAAGPAGRGERGDRHAHSSAIRRRRTKAMNTGAPMKAVTMPTCSSPGRATTRPMTSARDEQDGADDRRVRQQPAVVGTGDGPGDVGHGEPDEHDRTDGGRGAAAQQHDGRGATARTADALAERAGDVLAQGQAVEGAARGQRDDRPGDEERQHLRRARPSVPTGQRADRPEAELVERADVEQHHRRGQRANSAVRAAPATASFTGVAPPRPIDAEHVHGDGGDGGPGEGEPHVAEERREPKTAMPATTAKAAPALTPSRPGSASGLRVTPCMTAPARPRAAPTTRPSSVRGTRSSRTINWSSTDAVEGKTASQAWRHGIDLAPTAIDAQGGDDHEAHTAREPGRRA